MPTDTCRFDRENNTGACSYRPELSGHDLKNVEAELPSILQRSLGLIRLHYHLRVPSFAESAAANSSITYSAHPCSDKSYLVHVADFYVGQLSGSMLTALDLRCQSDK